MSDWILGDPTATNPEECEKYVTMAGIDAGLFAHDSDHASFQILTPIGTVRLSHGRYGEGAIKLNDNFLMLYTPCSSDIITGGMYYWIYLQLLSQGKNQVIIIYLVTSTILLNTPIYVYSTGKSNGALIINPQRLSPLGGKISRGGLLVVESYVHVVVDSPLAHVATKYKSLAAILEF